MDSRYLTPSIGGVPVVDSGSRPDVCRAGWIPTVDSSQVDLSVPPGKMLLLRYPPNRFRRLMWRLFLGVRWVPAVVPIAQDPPSSGSFLVVRTDNGVRVVIGVFPSRVHAELFSRDALGTGVESTILWSPRSDHQVGQSV